MYDYVDTDHLLISRSFISVRDPENLAPDYLEKLRYVCEGRRSLVNADNISEEHLLGQVNIRVLILKLSARS